MRLANNLKTFFPLTPDPPEAKVLEISNALDLAMVQHIEIVYVPAGFGATFLAGIPTQTPFLTLLSNYLDLVISPILTTALSLETNPSSPQPHLLAWANVQSAFDALITAVPPFMAGVDGLVLWQAILFTIRFFITPAPLPLPEDSPTSSDGLVTLEDAIT